MGQFCNFVNSPPDLPEIQTQMFLFLNSASNQVPERADWEFVSIGLWPQTCCLAVWPLVLWETKENTKYTLISLDFFISLPELRSMHVELYILKSKFGCHVPESNLSYCHVNLVGDVGQTFDSLVSLCSHFGIANKKHPKKLSTKYFEWSLETELGRVCPWLRLPVSNCTRRSRRGLEKFCGDPIRINYLRELRRGATFRGSGPGANH